MGVGVLQNAKCARSYLEVSFQPAKGQINNVFEKKSNLPGGETPHIKLKGFPVSIIEGLKLRISVSDLFKSRTVLPEELH